MSRIIVVGAGISGVTAAVELKTRGHDVVLVDPGPLPHPLAASTDISKAVRAAYGADDEYTELAERSIKIWREWNQEFGTQLYHEVGVMFVRRRELKPGDFEYESFKTLEHRGHKVERINSARSWKRFPAWNSELYLDGVLELEAGYAESGRVVATLIRRAKSLGVQLREGKFAAVDEKNLREFLSSTFPALEDAPIVYSRVCMYCDTHDGNFWIARDPDRRGLIIAAGDCGHGFKFAPVLGEIIADAVEETPNPILEKFRWRPEVRVGSGTDVARFNPQL